MGSIHGIITDINGKKMDGVDVILKNATDSLTVQHSFSAVNGDFQFDMVKEGILLYIGSIDRLCKNKKSEFRTCQRGSFHSKRSV